MSREAPIVVPMALRSPTLKPTLVREVPKRKKEKQKNPMLVRESPRKNDATQAKKKYKSSAKDKGKVVD